MLLVFIQHYTIRSPSQSRRFDYMRTVFGVRVFEYLNGRLLLIHASSCNVSLVRTRHATFRLYWLLVSPGISLSSLAPLISSSSKELKGKELTYVDKHCHVPLYWWYASRLHGGCLTESDAGSNYASEIQSPGDGEASLFIRFWTLRPRSRLSPLVGFLRPKIAFSRTNSPRSITSCVFH